jgi:hypothetical protein
MMQDIDKNAPNYNANASRLYAAHVEVRDAARGRSIRNYMLIAFILVMGISLNVAASHAMTSKQATKQVAKICKASKAKCKLVTRLANP